MGISTGDLNVSGVLDHTNSSGAYINGRNVAVALATVTASIPEHKGISLGPIAVPASSSITNVAFWVTHQLSASELTNWGVGCGEMNTANVPLRSNAVAQTLNIIPFDSPNTGSLFSSSAGSTTVKAGTGALTADPPLAEAYSLTSGDQAEVVLLWKTGASVVGLYFPTASYIHGFVGTNSLTASGVGAASNSIIGSGSVAMVVEFNYLSGNT